MPTAARSPSPDAPFSSEPDDPAPDDPALTGPWEGQMMAEGNGSPTLGELGRRIDDLSSRIGLLDGKIERFANLAVDARLAEFDRRLSVLERIQTTGQSQRSMAAWQILMLVLGMLTAIAGGVILASILGGK